jgi:hypothetical protein
MAAAPNVRAERRAYRRGAKAPYATRVRSSDLLGDRALHSPKLPLSFGTKHATTCEAKQRRRFTTAKVFDPATAAAANTTALNRKSIADAWAWTARHLAGPSTSAAARHFMSERTLRADAESPELPASSAEANRWNGSTCRPRLRDVRAAEANAPLVFFRTNTA